MAKKKFIIECEMNERWVDHFCSFLKELESNGNLGHSALVGFYSDGDGDFRPEFKIDTDFNRVNGIPKEHITGKPEVIYDAG